MHNSRFGQKVGTSCFRFADLLWGLFVALFLLTPELSHATEASNLATESGTSSKTNFAESNVSEKYAAQSLPEGMSFVALVDDEWLVLVVSEGDLLSIPGIQYPRSVSYHHGLQRIAWIGADNKLYERNLATNVTQSLGVDNEIARYTQPSYSPEGERLLVVELPDGRSRSTRIVSFELETGERHFLVRKRTAQFEPHAGNDRLLHYTTAICVDDCIGMIWELWQRDLFSGRQEQLTLMNAVSKAPRLGGDNWLYFSSDAAGDGFHIWRMRAEPGAATQQITSGEVRDSRPAPGPNGELYFIRHSRDGAALMKWTLGDEPQELMLDSRIRDVRDLELNP